MNHAYFVHLRALPAWLKLPRPQRAALAAQTLGAAIAASPDVRVRHFDAEAYSAPCSDIMLIETAQPAAHYFFMERLRDSVLLTEPYFEVLQIVPAIEDGYRAFEADAAQSSAMD